ncbi:MAG TPA: ABC transporter ATP-binding protein [Candidatus Nanopelagicaceae bacterium]|nr:ABC transporter ATP-binding protein [Candidatus Nanopelagicaceae bacterium]
MDTTVKKKTSVEADEKNQTDSVITGISKNLLEIENLKTNFYTEEGIVKAVDGVSFNMGRDEVLGLVGETGCGKSVTALSILRLVRPPGKILEGTIMFDGVNLLDLTEEQMREYRGKDITMIFQDPLNSLNPILQIGRQIAEVFLLHQEEELKEILEKRSLDRDKEKQVIKDLEEELKIKKIRLTKEEERELKAKIKNLKKNKTKKLSLKEIAWEKSEEIVKEVGIADAKGILKRYPHELSGGMRQRVMISMGLSCNPKLLIADEPTTALDVTIQAQILDLMKNLKKKFQTSILLITHDLGIIAELCERVAVMYSGTIVEYAPAEDLFKKPSHPYTKGLISSIPSIEKRDQELLTIRGMVPNLIYPPSGCRFHPRCDYRLETCDKVRPNNLEIDDKHFVACHLFDPKYKNSPKYQ